MRETGLTEAMEALASRMGEVGNGNLAAAENMLVGPASALNAMFMELSRRAALNMGEYPQAFERCMGLALKAQGQCRSTLETLSAMKNPPIVYARQANIAHSHQQMNNGTAPLPQPTRAHARTAENQQNGLTELEHEQRLDAGATSTPSAGDPPAAAMGARDRPKIG